MTTVRIFLVDRYNPTRRGDFSNIVCSVSSLQNAVELERLVNLVALDRFRIAITQRFKSRSGTAQFQHRLSHLANNKLYYDTRLPA